MNLLSWLQAMNYDTLKCYIGDPTQTHQFMREIRDGLNAFGKVPDSVQYAVLMDYCDVYHANKYGFTANPNVPGDDTPVS